MPFYGKLPPPPSGAIGAPLRFDGHKNWVNAVTFSSDGRQVLSGSTDKTVRLWDVATRQELHCLQGHTKTVRSVAISPDGRLAVSGAYDHTVRLWDLQTARQLHCFMEHAADVMSVAFALDGRHVISGSKDCTIRMWDVTTGEYCGGLEGTNAPSCQWAPKTSQRGALQNRPL